jgi:hypothetical protein
MHNTKDCILQYIESSLIIQTNKDVHNAFELVLIYPMQRGRFGKEKNAISKIQSSVNVARKHNEY